MSNVLGYDDMNDVTCFTILNTVPYLLLKKRFRSSRNMCI